MDFRITGLSPEPFLPLYGLPEAELAARGVIRQRVDADTGFPDRIEMREARPGETVLLLNHTCMDLPSPYRTTHAIYVREGATETFDAVNTIPAVMESRLLSLRAFDAAGMIVDAEVVEGAAMRPVLDRLLGQPQVAWVHAHNARRGCYSGRIERA